MVETAFIARSVLTNSDRSRSSRCIFKALAISSATISTFSILR
jgi:hypothetical protein